MIRRNPFREAARRTAQVVAPPSPMPRSQAYRGALSNRTTEDWILAGIKSADAEVKGDLRTLRRRARELARNTWACSRYAGILEDNLIGPEGIRLQSLARGPDGEVDENAAQAIEDAWVKWGERRTATADGRLNWHGVSELMVSTEATDGEAILRMLPGFDNDFGFSVQVLDSDQLDEEFNRPKSKTKNEIRMGVEVDKWTRPVRYWMYDAHPFDYQAAGRRDRVPIAAENLIHRYQIRRAGQTRGVSWFAPILMDAQMLSALQEGELIASRIAANKSGVFEVDPEMADDPELPSGINDFTWDMQPGVFETLPAGLKATFFDPTHPNSAFIGFSKIILHSIAAGLRTSYATLTGDLTDVNFSSIRAGTITEQDVYRRLQRHTWENIHRPIFRQWLRWAMAMGAIPGLPQGARYEEMEHHVWQPRGWTWVDPLKDAKTSELTLALGLDTRTRIAGQLGRSYPDMLRTREREKKLEERHGIEVEPVAAPAGFGERESDALALFLEEASDDDLADVVSRLNGGASRLKSLLR